MTRLAWVNDPVAGVCGPAVIVAPAIDGLVHVGTVNGPRIVSLAHCKPIETFRSARGNNNKTKK